jgi:hypothetical protein
MKRLIKNLAQFIVCLITLMVTCYLVLMFLSMIIKLFTR